MRVLVFNAGSSTLKFAVIGGGRNERGAIERIQATDFGDAAVDVLRRFPGVEAMGHRIVHGGDRWNAPARVTPEMLTDLDHLVPLDPDHLPSAIAILRTAIAKADVPQVACFDTAFHRDMPQMSRLLPIPRALGIRRHGFHGLSYASAMRELRRAGNEKGRIVLAHLGSGASLAAVQGGRCVDTTMGFTPASGIMMGTRSGDLDPGVIFHLLRTGLDTNEADRLLNHRSGLLGVSETSADMRDLLEHEATDSRAHDAVELFCHQTRKAVGAFAAVLGGLDTLVFTGGIGERSPVIRARVCGSLEHLGVRIDVARNRASEACISEAGSRVLVRVIAADEESIIAEETERVLS
jgi:acetate kinase